jgi:hypothetical protein
MNANRRTQGRSRKTPAGTWAAVAVMVLAGAGQPAHAWDYEVHRIVNQLALASLPTNFPAFVRTPDNRERIHFLAGEPDRWRNSPDLPFRHATAPDHFLDVEDLEPYGLDIEALSHFRYDYVAQLARARAAHPERFPAIDPARDGDRTKWLPGFLPWTIAESYARLKSVCSCLQAFEADGTREEVANARQNMVAAMGTMGHYVGDAANPLHTTRHYNGWLGDNPRGYTTNRTFHAWVDGGYLAKCGVDVPALLEQIRPARVLVAASPAPPDLFPEAIGFVRDQHVLVEPLYRLEQSGGLSGEGDRGREGIGFLTAQLLKAGQFLGDLWYTAWLNAPPDTFLKNQLSRRRAAAGGAKAN